MITENKNIQVIGDSFVQIILCILRIFVIQGQKLNAWYIFQFSHMFSNLVQIEKKLSRHIPILTFIDAIIYSGFTLHTRDKLA